MEMSSAGVAADVVAYSATISAFEKGQQWQCALRLLTEMRSAGVAAEVVIAANVVTYSATISACEKGQQLSALARRADGS